MELLYIPGESIKWNSSLKNCLIISNKIKHIPTIWSSNSPLIYLRKLKTCPQNDLYTNVYNSLIHIQLQSGDSPNVHSQKNRITNYMIYSYNGFYNKKKDELLIHSTTWMSLKTVLLSKRRKRQKNMKCTIPFIWSQETSKTNFWCLKWLLLLGRSFVQKGIKEIFWDNENGWYIVLGGCYKNMNMIYEGIPELSVQFLLLLVNL